jgi:Carbohydrate-selective porin, OprB family/S-layer homology domain
MGVVLSGIALAGGFGSIQPAIAQSNQLAGNGMELGLVADEAGALDQVTSVSQLSDVKPTDWAFQALQSLVERYGCIAGYPDKTYRGNRSLTRYEFAAGLNACMDRVNELISASTADMAKREDLEALRKLQEEFAAELATLRGRVDTLEARTSTLEKQQFSTTTKLNGEVIFGVTGIAAGQGPDQTDASNNTTMGYRARLNLDTSFSGKDLLRTRLQTGNLGAFPNNATGTPESDLRFATNGNGGVAIDALLYQFPLGDKTTVTIEANAGATDDFADTLNPYLDGDGGSGSVTHFGTRNPILYQVAGTGLGIKHEFTDKIALSLAYLANNASDPSSGAGLFDGPSSAFAQITFKPSDKLGIGLVYVNTYKNDFVSGGGNSGSLLANLFSSANTFFGADVPTKSESYGLQATYQISPKIVLNGSVGYTNTRVKGTSGDLDIWNWHAGLAFPDLGKKGNLGGLIVGMQPKVTGSSGDLGTAVSFINPVNPLGTPLYPNGKNRNTGLHIEGFYQYRVNDNITITPAIIWLTAPDHDNRNDDIVIGTIRTTFTF